jgi:hypothetical protein
MVSSHGDSVMDHGPNDLGAAAQQAECKPVRILVQFFAPSDGLSFMSVRVPAIDKSTVHHVVVQW